LQPLIVGYFAKSRCFKGISSLSASCAGSGQAWKTKEIFSNWITEIDKTMVKENKFLLLADNCSAHRVDGQLQHVKLDFLPASCTSLFQPMEQDIMVYKNTIQRSTLGRVLCLEIMLQLEVNVKTNGFLHYFVGSDGKSL
jgi:hypothetical protein